MSNKGHDNLIPQAHVLTVDEQSAGGKKSAETRRERRRAKDTLNALLALPVKAGSVADPDELESIKDKSNTDVNTAILIQLINSAMRGNIKAVQEIYTLTQERNTRMQIESEVTMDESLKKLHEMLDEDFSRTESAWDNIDHTEQARAFEWWCNKDNPDHIAHRFTSSDIDQIRRFYINADEWQKIDMVHKFLASEKIPNEDAVVLYDHKYLPAVLRYFETPEPPPEPQTIQELLEHERKAQNSGQNIPEV